MQRNSSAKASTKVSVSVPSSWSLVSWQRLMVLKQLCMNFLYEPQAAHCRLVEECVLYPEWQAWGRNLCQSDFIFFLFFSLSQEKSCFFIPQFHGLCHCNLLRLQGILQRNLENEIYDLKQYTENFSYGERNMSLRVFHVFLWGFSEVLWKTLKSFSQQPLVKESPYLSIEGGPHCFSYNVDWSRRVVTSIFPSLVPLLPVLPALSLALNREIRAHINQNTSLDLCTQVGHEEPMSVTLPKGSVKAQLWI